MSTKLVTNEKIVIEALTEEEIEPIKEFITLKKIDYLEKYNNSKCIDSFKIPNEDKSSFRVDRWNVEIIIEELDFNDFRDIQTRAISGNWVYDKDEGKKESWMGDYKEEIEEFFNRITTFEEKNNQIIILMNGKGLDFKKMFQFFKNKHIEENN